MAIHLTEQARQDVTIGKGTIYLDSDTGELNVAGRTTPHIIPGVLYPAYVASGTSPKLLDGTTTHGTGTYNGVAVSTAYGTVQADGRKYYYTNIAGSKPIKDPRIGGHFGSQRHKFKSLQLLEQETATHGSNVYSVDGREWMRTTGGVMEYASIGHQFYFSSSTSGVFIEIVGYFSDANIIGQSRQSTNRTFITSVDGGSATDQNGLEASADNPLRLRYVDAGSVVNLGLSQTLGLHTLKIQQKNSEVPEFYGIELIAQDTSNRNSIQIPSQNVVSYGKKFTVSGTPHYNPFNNQTIGDTTSHGKNTTGWTTYDSTLDTATSLGLDAWVDSGNYYRPVNGGRVVKWVDSSGNIKTSVNMMPPSAKAIGSHSGNSGPHETAWTTTYQPVFSSGSVDHTQSEVAKAFHFREFGNGGANGNASYKDLSVIGYQNSSDTHAYVMDDGLTSASGEAYISPTTGRLDWDASDSIYFTFIGTGFGRNAASNFTFAQNLPYGTHIVKINMNASSEWYSTITVDGVSLGTTFHAIYYSADDITFHQPKRPPIPEDACVIADYMLMADFVPATTHGFEKISKGVRYLNTSRDIFYDDSTGISLQHFGDSTFKSLGGFRASVSGTAKSIKLPVFGSGNALRYQSFTDRVANATFKVDGSAYGSSHSEYVSGNRFDVTNTSAWDTSANDGTFSNRFNTNGTNAEERVGIKDLAIGNRVFEISDTASGEYIVFSGMEIISPIHTSSHYQSFETPFLHELVGGDRNMEQTNLVVSPDGKTWDQITRDTSYIGANLLSLNFSNGDNANSNNIRIPDDCRGILDGKTLYNKNFAIAYDRVICLVDGQYQIDHALHYSQVHPLLMVNGTTVHQIHSINSNIYGSASVTFAMQLKRGDYIQTKGGYSAASNAQRYSNFQITKL